MKRIVFPLLLLVFPFAYLYLTRPYRNTVQVLFVCKCIITTLPVFSFFLALRRLDGSFVFNGNWAINWSGEYQAAGATFTYRRQDATMPELISTVGPLTEPIDLMVKGLQFK